jgi:non-ribosomal peptide synthetase component E (peptide arylation enzyme)
MMKKIVVTIVVIVAILGIAFAAYSNSNSKNPTTNNTTNTTTGTSNVNVSNATPINTQTATTSNKTQSIISPTEAQEIATKYIETSGVTAGTPKLMNESGTQVYIVPLIDTNKTTVGEIDIDAITGKNLGGAGGAP